MSMHAQLLRSAVCRRFECLATVPIRSVGRHKRRPARPGKSGGSPQARDRIRREEAGVEENPEEVGKSKWVEGDTIEVDRYQQGRRRTSELSESYGR